MIEHELPKDLAELLMADQDFAGVLVRAEHSSLERTLPAVVISCEVTPLDAEGKVGEVKLTATVQSAGAEQDESEETDDKALVVHRALVLLVRAKLLGAGRAQLEEALTNTGRWDLRGWSAGQPQLTVQEVHFETGVAVAGTVIYLG